MSDATGVTPLARLSLGEHADAFDATVARARDEHWAERLFDHDPSLWSSDARVQAAISERFGWLESQFLDYVQLQQATIGRGGAQITINRELNNSGNPLLNSPEFKVSLVAEQAIPLWHWGYLIPRWDSTWTDTTYYDASKGRGIPNTLGVQYLPKDTIAQQAFWLHNVRLGYRTPDGHLEAAFWVRNIYNTSYKTYAFDASTFAGTTIYFVGDPRTYGGSVSITF